MLVVGVQIPLDAFYKSSFVTYIVRIVVANKLDVRFIDEKGFVTTLGGDDSSIRIDHLAAANRLVFVNEEGRLLYATSSQGSIAYNTRYEYYSNSPGDQIASTGSSQLFIDGGASTEYGGLSTWDTATSKFQPESLGSVYTIRMNALVAPTGGNPILHSDFVVSGSDTSSEWDRHHQSVEVLVRATGQHQHVHAVYTVFTDQELFDSGAYIRLETTTGTITIKSASIMIKEG